MEFNIHSKAEYDAAMETLSEWMKRGEEHLTEGERSAFFRMAVAVERFEDQFLNTQNFAPNLTYTRCKISTLLG